MHEVGVVFSAKPTSRTKLYQILRLQAVFCDAINNFLKFLLHNHVSLSEQKLQDRPRISTPARVCSPTRIMLFETSSICAEEPDGEERYLLVSFDLVEPDTEMRT